MRLEATGDQVVAEGSAAAWQALQPAGRPGRGATARALREIEKDEIGAINYRIEQARLELRKLELEAARSRARRRRRARRDRAPVAEQQEQYEQKQQELAALRRADRQHAS